MESEGIGLMDLAAAGREYPQFGKSAWNTERSSSQVFKRQVGCEGSCGCGGSCSCGEGNADCRCGKEPNGGEGTSSDPGHPIAPWSHTTPDAIRKERQATKNLVQGLGLQQVQGVIKALKGLDHSRLDGLAATLLSSFGPGTGEAIDRLADHLRTLPPQTSTLPLLRRYLEGSNAADSTSDEEPDKGQLLDDPGLCHWEEQWGPPGINGISTESFGWECKADACKQAKGDCVEMRRSSKVFGTFTTCGCIDGNEKEKDKIRRKHEDNEGNPPGASDGDIPTWWESHWLDVLEIVIIVVVTVGTAAATGGVGGAAGGVAGKEAFKLVLRQIGKAAA